MRPEQELPLIFPPAGLDVSAEYSRQSPGTCADAENVRTFDPLLERKRGGSRPGLVKLAGQLNGTSVIQHLAVLVDPTTEGLSANNEIDGTGIPDPNTADFPNRVIPEFGSGVQLNRNISGESAAIAFVRSEMFTISNQANGQKTLTLATQPGLNNLLVVIALTESANEEDPTTQPGLRLSNFTNGSNSFTQGGVGDGYAEANFNGPVTHWKYALEMSLWYRIADAGATDSTIEFTVANGGGSNTRIRIVVLEYSGADEEGPLHDFDKESASESAAALLDWPSIDLNGTSGQLVVAAWCGFSLGSFSVDGDYTVRQTPTGVLASSASAFDQLSLSGVTHDVNFTSAETGAFVAVVASFHT